MRKLIFFLSSVLIINFIIGRSDWLVVRAEDSCTKNCVAIDDKGEKEKCVNEKIACYEGKIKEAQNAKTTLANAISILDSQAALTEAQIEKNKLDQVRIEMEMEVLSHRIEDLSIELSKLQEVLVERVDQNYRQSRQAASGLVAFLGSDDFSNYINTQQREKKLQSETTKMMVKTMDKKLNYNDQVGEKETAAAELEQAKKALIQKQTTLASQKQEKQTLLAQTNNDEKTFQNMLEQARKEISSYKAFTAGRGSHCLGSRPGGGDGGWHWSQRDPEWCNQLIGKSNETVGYVGCFITSISMVMKKHGYNMSPGDIAAESKYFVYGSAALASPPSIPGYSTRMVNGFDRELVDRELEAERPVIVKVGVSSNAYGTHFVVLKSGKDGNYKMNDPWEGADLSFNDYYSTGLIISMRLYTK